MNKSRAYSLITIKAIDEEQRTITGIATTPTTDRVGDIVEPSGAQFKLPLPLLWHHKHDQPIGHVTSAKVTKDGILITAKLVKIDEAGKLKDRLDEAWQALKSGLVRGLSIGFRVIQPFADNVELLENGGWRFLKWEWFELSAVTIPANAQASIQTVKLYDTAAHNKRPLPVVKLDLPNQPAKKRPLPVVKLNPSEQPFASTTKDTTRSLTEEELHAHPEWPGFYWNYKQKHPEWNEMWLLAGATRNFVTKLANQERKRTLDPIPEDTPLTKSEVRSMIRSHLDQRTNSILDFVMSGMGTIVRHTSK